ncbi:endonuclease V [Desulfuromonas soudanensis]|uniref:Endonuclease V n=1 Tax=Desulfuromonas soudanensis TaxID=1603606 RepID=A0A0M4D8P2_9BACT|nr:deoxyribonuclease V [Desulfuromonas soudanensis]ALC17735.1 endonuclease V [Desulfuromonas soudanensis]
MDLPCLHGWRLTGREAVALQRELAEKVVLADGLPRPVRTVAGVDVSYERNGDSFFAAVVVLELPDFKLIEEASATGRMSFPYVPGLLSFRELPVVLDAFSALRTVPDAVLVDGQGIAHPRRFGIACHLGLWTGLPTVGCAKSRLCGSHLPPAPHKGDWVPLLLDGEAVGAVLTSRRGVRPLYISPGHRTDLPSALRLVQSCLGSYRLPEPTRLAHLLSNRLRLQARN